MPHPKRFRISPVHAAAMALLLLGACADDAGTTTTGPVVAQASDYRLGPGDRVSIKVFGQQDISGEFDISATGQLSLPLIGQVGAATHTVTELQQIITNKLAEKYIVNPQVSIQVTNYRPFFILGQVNKPGSYPYQAGLNVRQAVAISGGYTRRAREEPVIIIRVGPNGHEQRIESNGSAPILPGDSIDVERRLF
ncbi:MAG TPA: polysaccharide biosynthesis/export family protein [Candidatus Sulfotelmatobacter sp.]|nr:polysaccharide biosynthesis/export family protein [Candidatus Sulfotelmatobacter sp.]